MQVEKVDRPNYVLNLYDRAYEQAETVVTEVTNTIDWKLGIPIVASARRVGGIMGRQFPTRKHTDWVVSDLQVMQNAVIDESTVAHTLDYIETLVWAYEPVSVTYAEGAMRQSSSTMHVDEIQMRAFSLVENCIQWNLEYPTAAKDISKRIGSYLNHLLSNVRTHTPPTIPLDSIEEYFTPNMFRVTPEEFYLVKEEIIEALATSTYTTEELWQLIEKQTPSESQDTAPRLRYYFPVTVEQPRAVWGLLAELQPRERMALLHNMGYIFEGKSNREVEDSIGLKNGNLKATLHTARKHIVDLWKADHYESRTYSSEQIRGLIDEAKQDGTLIFRLKNGRMDHSRTRKRLQAILQNDTSLLYKKTLSQELCDMVIMVCNGYTDTQVGEKYNLNMKQVDEQIRQALQALSG